MNSGCPIVSIVLPCYNAEAVVSAAIASAASSTIASNCELIIVNDGSTDHTEAVIEAACKQISEMKTRVINTPHRGVSAARNAALAVCAGKYIAFLDADDRLSPCMLERMAAGCEAHGADFSYCGWTSDLSQLSSTAAVPKAMSKDAVFSTLLYRSRELLLPCVLYRRETIEHCSLRFDESLRYGEDLAFMWQYALRCSVFIAFHPPLYYYARDNTDSAMHRVCWEMTDVLSALDAIRACIPPSEGALLRAYDAYMLPRYLLFLQKDFASGQQRQLFDRLQKRYPSVPSGLSSKSPMGH